MKASIALSVTLLTLLSRSAAAGDGLDVDAWLAKPGVKLLAVEFYATWCKPCMAAVPRWKALHDKYRREGLRLVVVATQDPKGGCVNPGWNPDDVVCDDDGQLAKRFGVQNLPAAYLWGWQGHLLTNGSHVEGVEAAVQKWMQTNPRVAVEVEAIARGSRVSRRGLRDSVRDALQGQDKLTVVASKAERKRLNALIHRSMSASTSSKYACEVGEQITANSLLRVSIRGKSRKRLFLSLLSAERGCQIASAVVDWYPRTSSVSIAEGVADLTHQLKSETQLPWLVAKTTPAQKAEPSEISTMLARARSAKARAELLEAKAKQEAEQARAAQLEEDWKSVKEIEVGLPAPLVALQPELDAYFAMEVTLNPKRLKRKMNAAEALACVGPKCKKPGKLTALLATLPRPIHQIAILVRTGDVYNEAARAIRDMPLPKRLSKDQQEIYRVELDNVALGPQEKANIAFKKALELARRYKITTDDVTRAKRLLRP